jgi:hypothetical protein
MHIYISIINFSGGIFHEITKEIGVEGVVALYHH